MAEVIGVASGALTLTTFAGKGSVSLYQALHSFQNRHREKRDLEKELQALSSNMDSLKTLASENEADFEDLRLPLLHCGEACEGFKDVLERSTKNSSESQTSSRDWAKLQYRGKDIVGFKNMLSEYNATFALAVGIFNLRTIKVTANVVQELKQNVADTRDDLENHLETLKEKIEDFRLSEANTQDAYVADRQWMAQEMESIKNCLAVCARASERVQEEKLNVYEHVTAAENAHQVIVSSFGQLISAKHVSAGAGATQYLGAVSDAAVEQLARSRGIDLSRRAEDMAMVGRRGDQ